MLAFEATRTKRKVFWSTQQWNVSNAPPPPPPSCKCLTSSSETLHPKLKKGAPPMSNVIVPVGDRAQQTCKNMNKISSTALVQVHNRLNYCSSSKWGANKPVTMNNLPSTDLVQVLNRLNDCSPQQSSKWWTTKCKTNKAVKMWTPDPDFQQGRWMKMIAFE
jgi:hypothetical protein